MKVMLMNKNYSILLFKFSNILMEKDNINKINAQKLSSHLQKPNIYKIFFSIKKYSNENINGIHNSLLFFLINLLLVRRDLDNSIKIILYSILSSIYYSIDDERSLLTIANKVRRIYLKELKKHNSKYVYDIFCHTGELLLKKKKFLDSFLFYQLIKDKIEYHNHSEEIREVMKFNLSTIHQKLSNVEIMKEIIDKCLNMFGKESERGPKMYMISFLWSKQLFQFVNLCNQTISNQTELQINDFFDPIKIFECYTNVNSQNSARVVFPYLINNQCILKQKDIWIDPQDEDNCNRVLVKGLKENENYFLVSEENYNYLNKIFTKDYSIVRYGELNKKTNIYEYEIDLQKLKILILYYDFIDLQRGDLIKFRSIQYSKKTTFLEFKQKIKRCIDFELKDLPHSEINTDNIKIYILPRRLMFDITYCFYHKITFETNNGKEFNVDNQSTIEVNKNIIFYSFHFLVLS